MGMDCHRAEELLSDHLEGTLNDVLRPELEAHLGACPACAELRRAIAEVVEALREFPALEPAADLAERAATRALATRRAERVRPFVSPRAVHPRFFVPSWIQAAAAGFVLVLSGTLLLLAGPAGPSRAATRLVNQTLTAGNYILERSDRLVEDVRILRVVITTAFEGRLDRVNDRMDDYRKRLQRRHSEADSKKRESGVPSSSVLRAGSFRTAAREET